LWGLIWVRFFRPDFLNPSGPPGTADTAGRRLSSYHTFQVPYREIKKKGWL